MPSTPRLAWWFGLLLVLSLLGFDRPALGRPWISEPRDWKVPLPAGDWYITQGPKDTLDCGREWTSHCSGVWNTCAIDVVKVIGNQSANKNQPILSPAAGRIVRAGYDSSGGGNFVMVEHGDGGRVSLYLHLNNPIYDKRGLEKYQREHGKTLPAVKEGDILGYMGWGGSGTSGGYHLHFNVFADRAARGCVSAVGIDGNSNLAAFQKIVSSNIQRGISEPPPSAPVPPQPPVTPPPPPPPPPSAPSRPTLSQPTDGDTLLPSTEVTLRWKAASNAAQYKVELWGGPYSLMTPCDWQSGTSCRIGQMRPGAMQWRVKARNSDGQESDWSETWDFVIQGPTEAATATSTQTTTPLPQAPQPPALREPSNGAALPQSTDVWFAWDLADGVSEYYLEYWGGPYGTLNSGWLRDTAYHVGQMWPGTYQWHVKARNASGTESNWSETRAFTIISQATTPPPATTITPTPSFTPSPPPSGPSVPSLSSPGNGASLTQVTDVTLVWNAASNAAQYKVELWGGPYSLMTPCNWQSGTSCRIGQMWPGVMSWHVKARSAGGQESSWSETWSFTIVQAATITPTFTSAPPPPSFGGNVAPQSQRSPDGIGSGNAFDGNLGTFWTDGLGHSFTLTLTLPGTKTIHRILVWDRPQNSPDNNQINALLVTLSNGMSKRFGMDSMGNRCIDITLSPPQSISTVTLKADDASGNNGLSEVEIWDGPKTGGLSCANGGAMP